MKRLLLILAIFCTYQYSIAQSKRTIDNDKLLEYYQSQRYVEAANYLQSIYNEDTQNPKEIKQLAYAYVMAGKLPEAEKNYLKLYEQQPKSLPILFSLASINVRRGNDEKAKEYYQEIIRNDTASFNAYKGLAELYKGEDKKTIDKRMSILYKANKLNPIDPDVAFDLCETYFKMENLNDALRVLDTALAADSTNLRLLKMKMPIGIATKNYKTSVDTGEALLKYGDSSSFVLNNLAKSYFLLLDYKNALKYFLKLDSQQALDNETLSYNIGMSYRGVKDYKNAIPYLQKAINQGISQKIASYYGLLGDSFEGVNKNIEANTAYKKGLQFENNGSLLYNIALVYETKLNDKKNAIDYYGQYLKTINTAEKPRLAGFIKNKIEELKRR
ncbi:tetratricopeptide repeat protein [Pedobacter sp. ASV1-7]|uniref:tetratricopeptide repeat protein n=1 Tax=Pedobacter sp. ASV1-7 TaxID=3145237 RepID=UPI0032E8FF6C